MRRMQEVLTRCLLEGGLSGAGHPIGQQLTMTQNYDTCPFFHNCNNDSDPSMENLLRNPRGFLNTTPPIRLIQHTPSIILHGSSVYSDEFEFWSLWLVSDTVFLHHSLFSFFFPSVLFTICYWGSQSLGNFQKEEQRNRGTNGAGRANRKCYNWINRGNNPGLSEAVKIHQPVAAGLEENNQCIICQEEFTGREDLGKLDCGHDYHFDCIKHWLVQKT